MIPGRHLPLRDTAVLPATRTGRLDRAPFGLTLALGVLLVLLCQPCLVSGDVLELKSGGVLRGELLPPAVGDLRDYVTIRTLSGATITLPRSSVAATRRRPLSLEEYARRARALKDSVAAHWKMAAWCEERGLDEQRQAHLLRLVTLDPDHVPAREALGHHWHDDRWMDHDEYMRLQGYVKYKNRYVTPQERELLVQAAAAAEEERDWSRKIHLWRGWLYGTHAERRAAALEALNEIESPLAVPALVRNFQDAENEEVRRLFVSILTDIPGRQPVAALVRQALEDVNYEIRYAALNALDPEQYVAARKRFVRELKNGNNAIVRRAAIGLERVGEEGNVPALVDALVTRHQYQVRVKDYSGASFGTDASVGTPPGALPPQVLEMIRSGQFPNGVIVLPSPDQPVRTRLVTVNYDHQNREVLSALIKLTGQNFGFDKQAWAKWWTAHKNGLLETP